MRDGSTLGSIMESFQDCQRFLAKSDMGIAGMKARLVACIQ